MTQITPRLSVSGPDRDGDYELELTHCGDDQDHAGCLFLSRAEADALIAALNPWRDIASAPKDGSEVLLLEPAHLSGRTGRWHISQASWLSDKRYAAGGCWIEGMWVVQPTHWQPLPPAPPSTDAAQSPAETMRAHLDTFGKD